MECLCSNLADLVDSVTGLMSGGISCSDSLACQHRSAIQVCAQAWACVSMMWLGVGILLFCLRGFAKAYSEQSESEAGA